MVFLNDKYILLTDYWKGIMESRLWAKKTISACCRIKGKRQRKSKEEYLKKSFEHCFERDILTYLRYRSMSRIMTKSCDDCSIGDPNLPRLYKEAIFG